MFSPLVFLFMAILAIELGPETTSHLTLFGALFLSSIAYVFLIFFLILQKQFFKNFYVSQIALILFILFLYYIVGIQTYFPKILASTATLVFYFIALGIGTSFQILRFVLPFSFIYLTYLVFDTLIFPQFGKGWIFLTVALFLLLNSIFLPIVTQKMWKCVHFPDSPLKKSLEDLCKKHHFRFRKMLIWEMISKDATAAVIGIFPQFRYILFSKPLLTSFSDEEIKATLAHEMGHCTHCHLMTVPLLLIGALPISFFFYPFLEKVSSLLSYLILATFFFCYIRFFVGFFLRSFEKQADLHVFACHISPNVLVQMFEKISTFNSTPLNRKNWHHGSLSKRIELLKMAEKYPEKIKRTHTKLKVYLLSYVLTIGSLTFYVFHF